MNFLTKGLLSLCLLVSSLFGQCTPSNSAFDTAYWLSQPLPVAALQNNAYPADLNQAMTLATQGFTVDVPIMVYHWDPCLVMALRATQGYTWVPSALQPPVLVAPGLSFNGQAYDPNSPPVGSIKVSVNAADFPPINPPPPPTATAGPTNPVGGLNFGNVYFTVVGDTRANGATFTDSRGTFTKTVIATPFGNEAFWSLTTPAPAQ